MLSRKKLQETEWADILRTTEAQNFLLYGFGSNHSLQRRLKQALSDVSRAQKRVSKDDWFLCPRFTLLVLRYSALAAQHEERRFKEITEAKTELFRKFPDTHEYYMGRWRTVPIHIPLIRTSTMGNDTATAGTTEAAGQPGVHCISKQDLVTSSADGEHERLTVFNYSDARNLFRDFIGDDP